jgi:F-type H+-transporting ATPase subunit a
MTLLAAFNVGDYVRHHMVDHPWPGCQISLLGIPLTWMSSGIAAMLLAASLTMVIVLPMARRVQAIPTRGQNALEALVVFVRDMIARPALHDRAYAYLSFLTTLFVFILAMNLVGLIPTEPVLYALSPWIPILRDRPIGGVATGVATVCVAMAAITLVTLIGSGLVQAARRVRYKRNWPWPACLAVSPVAWFLSLSPPIKGIVGVVMVVPMALLELMGAVLKCVSLMIRLCANMLAGHVLLAVLMMFTLQTISLWFETRAVHIFYVAPVCVGASVLACVLDMLVAGIQAYIFTFLTAMFLAMYAEASH